MTTALGFIFYMLGTIPKDDPAGMKPMLIILAIVLGLLYSAAVLLGALVPRLEADSLQHLVELEEESETVADAFGRYSNLSSALATVLMLVSEVARSERRPQSRDDIRADLANILQPLWGYSHQRQAFFGYDNEAFYSLAIYLHEDGVLKSVHRACHDEFKRVGKGLGRDWPVGKGHVGEAFEQEKILVAANLRAIGTMGDADRRLYASAASIPFFMGDEPVGVCVITSNREEQFDVYNDNTDEGREWFAQLFQAVQDILSAYFSLVRPDEKT